MKEKMWALMVIQSMNQWGEKKPLIDFDDDMWNYIIEESAKAGINTILLDVGDGIKYGSHPEISLENAWTKKRVHDEIKKCREKGIKIIPKLNFSTTHDYWLGEYAHMLSTNTYYKVCYDLIKEVYEIFEHPEYIHLGMDEENTKHACRRDRVRCRQRKLLWDDMRFLFDCVHETGAKPWIWSCPLFDDPEGYAENFDPDEAIISPWYYNSFNKERWTPVESRAEYVAYYNEDRYKELNIKFVEEDPFLVNFRKLAIPLMKEKGYNYVPCASVFNRCDYNHEELLQYFKENAPDDQIVGFISAPWVDTTSTERVKMFYEETFRFFKEAKEKIYK